MKLLMTFIFLSLSLISYSGKLVLVADNQVSSDTRAITLEYGVVQENYRDEQGNAFQTEEITLILKLISEYKEVAEVTYDPATAKFTIVANHLLNLDEMMNAINKRIEEEGVKK